MTTNEDYLAALDRQAMEQAGQLSTQNRWAHRTLGVVLAGGQSSRMGGNDKAVLKIDGRTMMDRCIERLSPQVDRVMISGNDGEARFGSDVEAIPDLLPDYAGPLAGILSSMRWAETYAPHFFWVVTVAVDTPFFPKDLVNRFVMAMGGPEPSVVLAQSGERIHPTFGLWPIALADDLEDFLASGERKTRLWASKHNCSQAHFTGPVIDDIEIDPFFNVNKPDDVPVAEAIASGLAEQAN